MNGKKGVGIIGCGSISTVHLAAIEGIEDISLLAVCDCDKSKVETVAEQYHCFGTTDMQVLLDIEAIEWVHIVTPHHCHVDMAIEAMRKGKNVILEKPVGINRESLNRLKEVRDQTNSKMGVILQNRFNPTSKAMKAYATSGELGRYLSGKGSVTWFREDSYYTQSPWRGQKETEGGGLLINQAIHTLDLLSYLPSRVTDVRADIGNYSHSYNDVEDMAMVQMKHENGAQSLFYGSNNYGVNSPVYLELHYEKGCLELKDQVAYLIRNGKREVIATDSVVEGKKSYWGLSHEECIRYIYKNIDADDSIVSLEEGLHATDIVLSAYASSDAKEWVPLANR